MPLYTHFMDVAVNFSQKRWNALLGTSFSEHVQLIGRAEILTMSGVRALERFEHVLENGFPHIEREEFQRRIHDKFTRCIAPQILGPAWDYAGPQIMKERGWRKRSFIAIALVPRQNGKTFCVAMYDAALLIFFATTPSQFPMYRVLYVSTKLEAGSIYLNYIRHSFLGETYRHLIEMESFKRIRLHGPEGQVSEVVIMPKAEKVSQRHEGCCHHKKERRKKKFAFHIHVFFGRSQERHTQTCASTFKHERRRFSRSVFC